MYNKDAKALFVGFIFDTSFDNPEWRIDADEDEEELKRTMHTEGADTKFSFVIKVPLPDTVNWEKEKHSIRTLELGEVGKDSETKPIAH